MNEKRKICVITGSNKGIGYETALTLGLNGWEVVLACRSFARGNQAVMSLNSILRQMDSGYQSQGLAVFMELDLSSFDSIESFILGYKKRYQGCDALICNAGIMGGPYTTTQEGFEAQFGINYLGHVALFTKLLPFLHKSYNARVIQVSSRAHERATLQPGEFFQIAFRSKENYNAWKAYTQSKLLQVLFTLKSQEVFGSPTLRFYAAHPGVIPTDLLLSPLPPFLKVPLRPLGTLLAKAGVVLTTPKKGSDVVSRLITRDPPLTGGTYWKAAQQHKPNPLCSDLSLQEEVWTGTWDLLSKHGISVP